MAFKQNAREYNAPKEKVWQALEQACGSMKWAITSRNPDQGIMEMKSGASLLCPLGILLSICLTPVDPQKTQVTVEARSRGQLVDYGQSGREIKRLFETLDNTMVSVSETANQIVDGILCPKCGCPLKPGVKFCKKCGELVTTGEAEIQKAQNSCIKCGKKLDSSMRFCPVCGEPQ